MGKNWTYPPFEQRIFLCDLTKLFIISLNIFIELDPETS